MPIAAVMLDLDFSPDAVKAVPILARTAGLLAHLAEERDRLLGLLMAASAEEAIEHRGGPEDSPVMLTAEVETRPWAGQLAIDDAAYREQLEYLFDRSDFYREKLPRRGSRPPAPRAGSPRSWRR